MAINNILKMCEWFNSLEQSSQVNILDFLTNKTNELLISEVDKNTFFDFIKCVVSFIIENNDEKDLILKTLNSYGLDKIVVNALYAFCRFLAIPHLDAKLLSTMEKENVRKVADFVINKMILFNDYVQIPFNQFVELTGFGEAKQANRILRFIKSLYVDVSERKYSPIVLENKLKNDYGISSELTDEIVNLAKENRAEMHQAYMLEQINKLLNQISTLSCTMDNK